MEHKLQINGTQSFAGKEIPIVLGGFGANKRCISDKTIAKIHDMNTFDVRRRVTDNIKRFTENVDFIDMIQRMREAQTLKSSQRVSEHDAFELLLNLGYSKQSISQAEHIYILSERGYAKLIKIMDTDLAWEIHDRLIDEYFELRENEYEMPHDYPTALRMLADQCEANIELKTVIEEQKPLVQFATDVGSTKDLITVSQMAKLVHDEHIPLGRNKLFAWLKDKNYLRDNTEPYQTFVDKGYFKVREVPKHTPYGVKVYTQTCITGKGQIYLIEKLRKEFSDYLTTAQ